jgi:hypothetical protein
LQILTAELWSKVAGSIPLDKADQWAQALRELAEQAKQKKKAFCCLLQSMCLTRPYLK